MPVPKRVESRPSEARVSPRRSDRAGEDSGGGQGVEELTGRARSWPTLVQFAVFVENRVGRLHSLMRHLESHAVRIVAISIANSVDCAIVRLMVNDTDRGREILELSRFPFAEIELVGVELPEGDQPFLQVFLALLQAEVNVQYTYPLLYRRGQGAIALYVDDVDQAVAVLKNRGLKVITESDLLLD
jgi:hypothetical protein